MQILSFNIRQKDKTYKSGITFWMSKGLTALKYDGENKLIDLTRGHKRFKKLTATLTLNVQK